MIDRESMASALKALEEAHAHHEFFMHARGDDEYMIAAHIGTTEIAALETKWRATPAAALADMERLLANKATKH